MFGVMRCWWSRMLRRFARGLLSKKCRRLNGHRLQIFLRPIIADNAFKKCCASYNYFLSLRQFQRSVY